jgi:hypothetical protein
MIWKGYGRQRSWPNLRYYAGIFPGGIEENHESIGQDRRSDIHLTATIGESLFQTVTSMTGLNFMFAE